MESSALALAKQQPTQLRYAATEVTMAIDVGLLPDLVDQNGAITTEANLLKLGDVLLFAVPGELLPKLGLIQKAEMKKAGGQAVAIIGLVNDEIGYILPAEDFHYPADPF